MTKATVIRYQTKSEEEAKENARLVEAVFKQLAEQHPTGLRYAALRFPEGNGFMHMLITEGDTNPLAELPAFQDFQSTIADRLAGPPEVTETELLGSYRVFD
jgi:hypothetical protein